MNYEKFVPALGSWAPKLKPFIESLECDGIYESLRTLKAQGHKITPTSDQLYRAFQECPYKDLKCVFLLQDPYQKTIDGVRVADGIPMSCSNTGVLQPSLIQFYNAIEEDLYGGLNLVLERNPDLTYLARQGVLLLNSALTTKIGESSAHLKLGIWNPFIEYVLKMLNNENQGLIFVFVGGPAQEFSYLINPKIHNVFELEHPAYAARQNRTWKHNGIFSKINTILKENNGITLEWALEEIPF
jgi:uracil-DNA glycosylase